MERVNTANRTEEMARRAGVETVLCERVRALRHLNARQRRGNHDRPTHPAKRADTSTRGIPAVRQLNRKFHRPTMTLCMTNVSHRLYPFSH